jgi:hypothetical protein
MLSGKARLSPPLFIFLNVPSLFFCLESETFTSVLPSGKSLIRFKALSLIQDCTLLIFLTSLRLKLD